MLRGWGGAPQRGEADPSRGEGFQGVLGGQGAGYGLDLGSPKAEVVRLRAAGVSEEELLRDVASGASTAEAGDPASQVAVEDTPEEPCRGAGGRSETPLSPRPKM